MTKASGDKWGIVDHMVKLQTFTLKVKVPHLATVASSFGHSQKGSRLVWGQTESTASLRPGPVSLTSDLLQFNSLQHDVQMNNYRAR